jgi:hypothetical protein
MQRSLREHIAYLEQKSEALKVVINDPDSTEEEKVDARIDLDISERALAHFRRAFDLEQRLPK